MKYLIIALLVLLPVGFVVAQRQAAVTPCVLNALAVNTDRHAPMFEWTGGSNTDVLGIQNRDTAAWTNVVIAVYGFVTTGTGGRQVTGRFEHRLDDDWPAKKLRGFALSKFTDASGQQWTSYTMEPREVEISATRDGQACTTTVTLETP